MLRTIIFPAAVFLLVSMPANAQQPRNTLDPGAASNPASGTITGTLSYPSDHIPREIHICAEGVESKKIVCTNEHFTQTGKDARTTYRLQVEPGPYRVFSILPESSDFEPSAVSTTVLTILSSSRADHRRAVRRTSPSWSRSWRARRSKGSIPTIGMPRTDFTSDC